MADGNPLPRSSFNRYRDEICELFGLVMNCDENYRYYFANPEAIDNHSIESWMLSTMTVNRVLSESADVKNSIILEDVPAGEEFLPTIIEALKLNHRLHMGYQKFGCELSERLVEPYALKLSRRRWYLLVRENGQFKTFSLDRMRSLTMTEESFEPIEGFSAHDYYADYFGVLTDGTPMVHIVIRAYGKMANYLRTLPIHSSQQELESTADYTDYSFDVRPTADFIGELMSYGDGLEVLKPDDFRLKICELFKQTLNLY